MNLVWLTDLHFEFLSNARKRYFLEDVGRIKPDGIIITGDISAPHKIERDLGLFSEILSVPVYFCLGNHDMYGLGFSDVDRLVDSICLSHPTLHHLGKGEVIELSHNVALVGHRGWGDGRAGSGAKTPVTLNDSVLIEDLKRCQSRQELFEKMASLGRESADYFREVLFKALNCYREVFVATHVPPFPEATWHEGKLSGKDFLPHFCNLSAGEALCDVARQFPDRRIIILCGHTHSAGYYEEANIECWTGGAIYGEPSVTGVFNIE